MHRAILPQFSGGGKAREKTLQPGADAKKAPPPSPLSAPSPTAALCRRPAAVFLQWALSATRPNEPLQRPPLAGTHRSRWRRKEAGQGIGGEARRTQPPKRRVRRPPPSVSQTCFPLPPRFRGRPFPRAHARSADRTIPELPGTRHARPRPRAALPRLPRQGALSAASLPPRFHSRFPAAPGRSPTKKHRRPAERYFRGRQHIMRLV